MLVKFVLVLVLVKCGLSKEYLTDLAVTHATLIQFTVPHLETKEEPNFVNTSCTKKVVPSDEKLYTV